MKENEESKKYRIYKTVMLIVLTAFITFIITSLSLFNYYSQNGITSLIKESTLNTTDDYIERIRNIIDKYYLWNDEIDESKLESSLIKGYVEGLGDKYTEYVPKDEVEDFNEDITGTFVGIGIYMVADEEKGIIVYYPIPESPAKEAGIKSGDIIKKVDDVEYTYADFDKISDYIKGEEGTKVKLVVERDGKDLEFEIVRKKIVANPIVTEMLENNIGYIYLPSFDSGCSENFKTKVDELIKNGAKSLIIDLRNNGGGMVDESTKIADYFLEKNSVIMTTKDNKDKSDVTKSTNKPIYDLPVCILSNENTASASEILIGALKDNNKATIVGNKTYGKGVIQTVIPLSDGSELKITTEEYFTPNNTAIHKVGIEPNIEIDLPDSVTNIYAVERKNDTQLKKAIEELKK